MGGITIFVSPRDELTNDIQGRKVMDVNTSGTQINIKGVLMPGVYFVKVNNGKPERITVIR